MAVPMSNSHQLIDQFGRVHDYLRISLTERCNLRCTYCMPAEGIVLRPRAEFMRTEEVIAIAKIFVSLGVKKIRLTGGEPLVRNDAKAVIEQLAALPIELAISTNGILVDQFIDTFLGAGIKAVNVSLDSLNPEKNNLITRRSYFDKTMANIQLLRDSGIKAKINMVVMRGVNDDEVTDFIEWTINSDIHVRFIEFMPFDGNEWNWSRGVGLDELLAMAGERFGKNNIKRRDDAPNDTAKNYQIAGAKGSFAIISTVTNPFCGTCNRIRLTADGKMKNCLFSNSESDLLSALRAGEDIIPIIRASIYHKKAVRAGMTEFDQFADPALHGDNRSMIKIGG